MPSHVAICWCSEADIIRELEWYISLYNTFLPSFFYLLLTTYVKGEIIQTFIIMHNYEIMLVIILGNLNIYVVKLKKSENNSAPKLGLNLIT